MKILTDEEIKYHWTSMSDMSSTEYGILRSVAQAQLDKYTEELNQWGKEYCTNDSHSSGHWVQGLVEMQHDLKRCCVECWNELVNVPEEK
jgi:hypothetical protein